MRGRSISGSVTGRRRSAPADQPGAQPESGQRGQQQPGALIPAASKRQLNLRLGEIWERWLGDTESAAARYHRVLDADPKNRTAQLRLAELAEARGDLEAARTLYEDVLAVEEEVGDPEATPDLVAAYTRLARVTISSDRPSSRSSRSQWRT